METATIENTNTIVQSLWIGDNLSEMEQMCIRSFIQNGHIFHLYVYEEVKNIPKGVILKDANTIIPSDKIFYDSLKLVASFSDWFRYQLLFDIGGWWVDMDIICLKFFDIKSEFCFATEKGNMENYQGVTNAVIKSPKNEEFLKDILNYINAIILEGNLNIAWGEFGPVLLNNVIKQYDCKDFICSPEVFCPINWYDLKDLINDESFVFSKNSFAVHLWNHLWTQHGLDKDLEYATNSIYENLKSKFSLDYGTKNQFQNF